MSARSQHRSDWTREILFVDRGVADLPTILRSLQPGIEAILLERDRPAARQIAAALARRPGLRTLHVIAHGAPGRVSFASGDWSLETLAEETQDFTAIGEALGLDGRLLLWSCRTGAGAAGAAFLEGLTQTTGAHTAAAVGLVGAAALGGAWALAPRSRRDAPEPPLTAAGIAAYAGCFPPTRSVAAFFQGTISNMSLGHGPKPRLPAMAGTRVFLLSRAVPTWFSSTTARTN